MQVQQFIRNSRNVCVEKSALVMRVTLAAVIAFALSVPFAPQGEAWATETAANASTVFATAAASADKYDEGLADFMDYIGAKQAAQLLRNPDWTSAPLNYNSSLKMASYTKLGASGDATSIENLQKTAQWVRECNNKRAQEAREKGTSIPALKISPYLMAVSALQGNWTAADAKRSHAGKFGAAENLAWGYPNPFDGWYTEEKRLFDRQYPGKKAWEVGFGGAVGHYQNVVNPRYTVTGYSICSSQHLYSGCQQHEQSFSYSPVNGETIYTPDEFEKKVNEWLAQRSTTPTTPTQAATPSSTKTTMYRLYNKWNGEHFYTSDTKERNHLVSVGWNNEGTGWTAPKTGNEVYRLYNRYAGDHHYTTSATERDACVKAGWRYEGVGWYSDTARGVRVYREYNPNAVTGTHNYTTSKREHDALIKAGWKDEGTAWYGVK